MATARDPHIATLTATLKDDQGHALAGKTVTFKWDMPGPAPEITRPATTDSNGVATVDVVSGDTLSKAFDEEDGHLLYDEPVEVEASYGDAKQSKNLDVLAPVLSWQYKNEEDQYVPWKGEVDGLYSRESKRMKIPLKVVLTFNNAPIIGHRVSWDIDGIYDKGGGPVLPDTDEYRAYGRISGAISTSTREGDATATFSPGYRKGQLVFAFTDASVLIRDSNAPIPQISSGEFQVAAASSARYDAKKGRYVTIPVTEYDWVGYVGSNPHFADGTPSGGKDWRGYPARSGTEDDELLKPTLTLARRIMVASKESKTNSRYQTLGTDISGSLPDNPPDPYLQNGYWWFAQAVSNDRESVGTHLADVKVTSTKYDPLKKKDVSVTNYYSGAFDIVLTKVPIFARVPGVAKNKEKGRRAEFGAAVKGMRDNGIVAWHRWAGESGTTSENEMHCIDPATPFLKNRLGQLKANQKIGGQIGSFLRGETGGGYPDEPDTGPFAITGGPKGQKTKVRNRFFNKFSVLGAQPDNVDP